MIIYQTKNGGLREIGGRREGSKGQHNIENILKIFVIKQLFKNLSLAYTPEASFFVKPILLMLRVNIPCVANMVISRSVHTVNHVFHVFACRKGVREAEC